MPWGKSFHYDLKGCDMKIITSKEKLNEWVIDLVDSISMERHGDAIIEHFGTPGTNLEGYTLLQLIKTSSITLHANDNTGEAYLDIFTCKLIYNLELKIEQNIIKWFKPSHITYKTLSRQA